jgi:hypothetical protein
VSLSQLHLGQVLDLRGRRDDAKAAYEKVLTFPDESDSHRDARAGLASPFQPPARSQGPTPDLLARFPGTYDNGNGMVLSVTLKETGVLMVARPGRPEGSLEWIEGTRFRVAGASDLFLEFLGAPQVTSVDLTVSGNVIRLPRTQ